MPSQPFNFYQGTGFGTGIHAPATYIDFFTGIYIQQSVLLGGLVGFLWPLSDLEIYQTLSISGEQSDSNKSIVGVNVSFYGFVSPLITDSGRLGLSIVSGQVVSSGPDILPFQFGISSNISGDNIDKPNFNLILNSGNIISGNRDVPSLGITFSGENIQTNTDVLSFRVSFWGQFTVPDSDSAFTNMRMSDIAYVDTVSFITRTGSTEISTNLRLTNIIYDNAV